MTYQEIAGLARGQMGPCKACPVCDGKAWPGDHSRSRRQRRG